METVEGIWTMSRAGCSTESKEGAGDTECLLYKPGPEFAPHLLHKSWVWRYTSNPSTVDPRGSLDKWSSPINKLQSETLSQEIEWSQARW